MFYCRKLANLGSYIYGIALMIIRLHRLMGLPHGKALVKYTGLRFASKDQTVNQEKHSNPLVGPWCSSRLQDMRLPSIVGLIIVNLLI